MQVKNLITTVKYAVILIVLIISVSAAQAQTSATQSNDEQKYIVPGRPSVSNPAEFQKPGVLQLEYGYDGNFRSSEFRSQHSAPLSLRFAVNKRILLELDTELPLSETDNDGLRETGTGDIQLGIQTVLLSEKKKRPGIAFSYFIKLPIASKEKELGTGRFDHSFTGLISKKIDKTTVDFNATYLLAGRTSRNGFASSAQAALAVSQELSKKYGIQGEISGYSRNDLQSGAMFAMGAFTYQLNKRAVFDAGLRFGLTPDAPKIGVIAGITIGIVDLFNKK